MKLRKALYGLLQAALLFYEKLSADLIENGFKINPYDPCVANKMINGRQMTVVWHVDDLKVSHRDSREVDKFIEFIKSKYEDDAGKVKVTRGKKHKYLGMTFDYSVPGSVRIDMNDYIESFLELFPEDVYGSAATPATEALFKVNEDCPKLSESKAQDFHTSVAKALFLCKRARPDIQVAVAFLTTRVTEPDEDDWKKLVRLMKYLNGSKGLMLTLNASDNNDLKWWVDASYAVQPNMRSHTGIAFSMGKGTPICSSTKQKLNTKSSTEAELVGADDAMPIVLWTSYFLKEQGYGTTIPIMYQDNKSAMLLEQNGNRSSSRRTKHINVRYYFITDKINSEELKIEYCPTDDMLADFLSKPLQGKKFKQFRRKIMNMHEA